MHLQSFHPILMNFSFLVVVVGVVVVFLFLFALLCSNLFNYCSAVCAGFMYRVSLFNVHLKACFIFVDCSLFRISLASHSGYFSFHSSQTNTYILDTQAVYFMHGLLWCLATAFTTASLMVSKFWTMDKIGPLSKRFNQDQKVKVKKKVFEVRNHDE